MLTIEQRITEARAFFTEGRVCRGAWRKTEEDGREMACFLGAFGADIESASDCPGEIMPAWAAHLSVEFDDRTSDEAWPGIMKRYGDAATRWQSLSEAAWRRVLLKTLDASLAVAEPHSKGSSVTSVRSLIARELAGDPPSKAEMQSQPPSSKVNHERDTRGIS